MRKSWLAATALVLAAGSVPAFAETFTIDLTHPLPTFQPMAGDPMKPDLNQP